METKSEIIRVKIADLHPNPYQPEGRVAVNQETAKTFGMSILEHGLLQTPVCRVAGTAKKRHYEMGDGWLRRSGFAWLVENGYPDYGEMPVETREFTDQQMADLVLEANSVRHDLNPIDLAWYYRKVLTDFPKVTQAEFARRHQKSQGEVANTVRLLDLPEDIQQLIISHEISESHGRTLLQVKEPDVLRRYAADVVARGWSVAFLDGEIKLYLSNLKPRMEIPAAPTSVPTCRVCGCTDDKPCHAEDGPCHWVEDDLCSVCAAAEPPAPGPETPEVEMETPAGETETGGDDTGETTPPAAPPAPPAAPPAAPPTTPKLTKPVPTRTTTPTAAPTVWRRKLVLEEKADHVMVSVMRDGGFPVMKRIDGSLEQALTAALGVLADATEAWDKKEAN